MKTHLQRLLFLPTLLGTLLMVSLLLTPGVAFAAPTQAHSTKKASVIANQNNCSATVVTTVVIATDGGANVDCFSGEGTENVNLYDVTAIETGQYSLTFTWIGYDGSTHTASKPAWTFLSAGNASANAFAGYGSIEDITSITQYVVAPIEPTNCNFPYGLGVYIATHANNSTMYYTDCFSASGTHTVGLYGVYALETGYYTLTFTWKDYAGGVHTSTKPPRTFLAAGNASANGFAGDTSMAMITSITIA